MGNWKASWAVVSQDWVTWILISLVGSFALGCGIWGGFQYCYLKAKQGHKLQWQDVLWPWKSGRTLDLFIGGIIGFAFYPFLAAMWGFNTPLQVDRGATFGDAMTEGKKETGKSYVAYLLYFFLVSIIGAIPLVGAPLLIGATMEGFAQKFGGFRFHVLLQTPQPQQIPAKVRRQDNQLQVPPLRASQLPLLGKTMRVRMSSTLARPRRWNSSQSSKIQMAHSPVPTATIPSLLVRRQHVHPVALSS